VEAEFNDGRILLVRNWYGGFLAVIRAFIFWRLVESKSNPSSELWRGMWTSLAVVLQSICVKEVEEPDRWGNEASGEGAPL
jgi:hypothetical protein